MLLDLAPSLFWRVIPHTSGSLFSSISPWWWLVIGDILVVILARRHSIISYGTAFTSLLGSLLMGVLLLTPLCTSLSLSLGYLLLLLFICYIEGWIHSIGHTSRYALLVDQGLVLSIMASVHLASLLFLPLLLFRLRRIGLLTSKHVASLFLGLFSGMVLWLMLFASPSVQGLLDYYNHLRVGLCTLSVPYRGLDLLYLIALVVMALALSIFAQSFYERALERHRLILITHLLSLWLAVALVVLYGFSVPLFVCIALFNIVMIMQLAMSTLKDPIWLGLLFVPLLAFLALKVFFITV